MALEEAERNAGILNQYRALIQDAAYSAQGFGGRIAARVGGAVVGGAVGGIPGAIAGGAVGGGISALAQPAERLRALAMLDHLSAKVDSRVTSSVRTFIRRATGGTRRVGRAVRGAAVRAGHLADRQAFEERLERVQSTTASPEAMQAQLAETTRELDGHAPAVRDAVHSTAIRGIAFLANRAPQPTGVRGTLLPGLGGRARYLESDRVTWMQYARIVDNPLLALDDLENGRLSMESVEALREVYPSLHRAIVREAMSELAARADRGDISYGAKTQLSILLGTPTDPTLTPEFIEAFQRTFQIPPNQPAPSTRASGARLNLASSQSTSQQSFEARRAST
jgi:hypothetical protein